MKLRTWLRLVVMPLLIVSLLVSNTRPVAADEAVLSWSQLTMPEDGINGDWVIANNGGVGTGVSQIAIGPDDKTFYALDSGTPLLFKSADGGYTWTNITGRVAGFTSLSYLAMSPDDANFVAVVDATTPEVFLSLNGGVNFMRTGVAGLGVTGTIQSIAISRSFGAGGGITRDVTFGTSNGASGGQVWVMSVGAQFQPWTNLSAGAPGWTAQDVFAIVYSPNYHVDRTAMILGADNVGKPDDVGNPGTTWLSLGRIESTSQRVTWNAPLFPGYPVSLSTVGRDSPGTPLSYAALSLPSDYSGADVFSHHGFVSWSDGVGGNTNDDVYRFDNTTFVSLNAGNGSEFVAASLAYYGSYDKGRLLAGQSLGSSAPPMPPSVQVLFSFDPQSRSPVWQSSQKPPTGSREARVAWSADGKTAYCGTMGTGANDESAFSRSIDSGLSWNQTGLIDTRITIINDLQVAPDGSTLFVATVNSGSANADSLWRLTSTPSDKRWERVLSRSSAGTGDNPLIRIDPDFQSTLALWYVNTDPLLPFQELLISYNGGNTYSSGFPGIVIADLAAEDKDTIYAVNASGLVCKGTGGGKAWGTPVNTYLGSGYSISCARSTTTPDNDKGNVLVGGGGLGNQGVAYSTNGAATFTRIDALLPTSGHTLVAASSGYNSDGNIVAINSGGMYVWSIFTGQKDWETWWGGASWPSSITGLQISRNYGFYFTEPATGWSAATPYVRWCAAYAGLDVNINLGAQPARKMAISGGMIAGDPVTLWIIDQRPYNPPQGGIWHFSDTLSWVGPTPTDPASGALIDYDTVSGRATEIILHWEPRSLSSSYQVQIALDEDFSNIVADIGGGWAGPFYRPPSSESPTLNIPPGGGIVTDRQGNIWTVPAFLAGKTYYWRVRVQNVAPGDSIKSPWSWTEFFAIKLGMPVRAPHSSQQ